MKTIFVFGDSHTCMFSKTYKSPDFVESECSVQFNNISKLTCTAYGLFKQDETIRETLKTLDKSSEVWFLFGEIDIRFYIFYKMQEEEISLEESISIVVKSYLIYIEKLRLDGFPIHVVSIVPTQTNDLPYHNDPLFESKNPVRGKGITVIDRILATEMFNYILKFECRNRKIPFRNIHPFLVNPETRCLREDLSRDSGMHCYYMGDMFSKLIESGLL